MSYDTIAQLLWKWLKALRNTKSMLQYLYCDQSRVYKHYNRCTAPFALLEIPDSVGEPKLVRTYYGGNPSYSQPLISLAIRFGKRCEPGASADLLGHQTCTRKE